MLSGRTAARLIGREDIKIINVDRRDSRILYREVKSLEFASLWITPAARRATACLFAQAVVTLAIKPINNYNL